MEMIMHPNADFLGTAELGNVPTDVELRGAALLALSR